MKMEVKMKIKVILASLFLALFLIAPANAFEVSWDLSGVGITGSGNSKTDLFAQLQFYAESTITQLESNGDGILSAGDAFYDDGVLFGGQLLPPPIDDEGLGTNYQITGDMINFGGTVTDVSLDGSGYTRVDYSYNTGILDLYANQNITADFDNRTGFTDGTLIASFEIIYGFGHAIIDPTGQDVTNGGLGEFLLKATNLAQNFWFNEDGDDLADIYNDIDRPLEWLVSFADYNVDDTELTPNADPDILFTVEATHDGSIRFDAVPEPATMILFGIGLLGVAGISRKKTI